jgi:hypothetical protein
MAMQCSRRFVSLRHFSGRPSFVPSEWRRDGETHVLTQRLEAGYYQPVRQRVEPSRDEWVAVRAKRRVTELCKLEQKASIVRTEAGFRVRVQASGTDDVPLAVELGFREGGRIEGCEPVHATDGAWLLRTGSAMYRAGGNKISIHGGAGEHAYVTVRGAEPKLPGPCVYLTGYTPFDHTFTIELD